MKRLPTTMVLMMVAFIIFAMNLHAQQVLTPDTLVISPLPPGNVNTVINGDTTSNGLRKHPNRVYELKRGLVYQVSEPMEVNGSITVIDSGSTTARPPVLAPQILQNNGSIDHFFDLNGKGGRVIIKNVYLLSVRSDNAVLGWSDGIRINADSVKLTLQGDIFDGFTHTALSLAGQWDKLLVTDCEFRNEMHPSAYFGGGAFLSNGSTDMDTTIFINNTFFCNNSYDFSVRGYCPNAVFSHNTLVYGTVDPFLTYFAQNLHMDNNLFYGMHAYGGNPIQIINSWLLCWPDTTASGIVQVLATDTTSPWYYMWGGGDSLTTLIPGPNQLYVGTGGTGNATVTAAEENPSSRVFDLRDNDYFWPQKLYTDYKTYNDTVKTIDTVSAYPNGTVSGKKEAMVRRLYLPVWEAVYARYVISKMDSNGANVDTLGNTNFDPGFNTDIQNEFNRLMTYVIGISTGTLTGTSRWYYRVNNDTLEYPPTWPLPENLTYTNSALMHAGTDGYAIGDLNWFPAQKAAWLAAGGVKLDGIRKLPDVIPSKFDLSNNYPNPFNPSTNIKFSLPAAGNVILKIYNIEGQMVKTLIDNAYLSKGEYHYSINMNNLASGVYFYRLEEGANVVTKKMMLLK